MFNFSSADVPPLIPVVEYLNYLIAEVFQFLTNLFSGSRMLPPFLYNLT